MVRALALSWCRDADAADDIVQETFWRAYRSFREAQSPKPWLYTLVHHAALDYLRARRRRKRLEQKMRTEAVVSGAKKDDRVGKVMEIVDGLREDYRRILLLRHVDGLSYGQIARVLEMTPGAVGEKLHRVRKLVMERLGL